MNIASAPFIRTENKIRKIQIDILAVCAVLLLQSLFNYGYNPLLVTAVCIASSVAVECLGSLVLKKPITLYDLTAVKSGAVLAMLLPPTVPLWIALIGGVLVGLVKIPFIGRGASPFIPEAISFAVLTVAFKKWIFSYVIPTGLFSFFTSSDSFIAAQSAAGKLADGSISPFSFYELFLGVAPAAIGSSLIALILCGFIYLICRKSVNYYAVGAFLIACVLLWAVFPRGTFDSITSIMHELTAGSILFCGVFFVGDKYTSPKTTVASIIYGLLAGVACVLIRNIGIYEQTACFVIVIMTLLAPFLDRWIWKLTRAF